MKFTVEALMAKLPLPADEKWKEGVWDVKPLKKERFRSYFSRRAELIIKLFTKKTNFT